MTIWYMRLMEKRHSHLLDSVWELKAKEVQQNKRVIKAYLGVTEDA